MTEDLAAQLELWMTAHASGEILEHERVNRSAAAAFEARDSGRSIVNEQLEVLGLKVFDKAAPGTDHDGNQHLLDRDAVGEGRVRCSLVGHLCGR